MGKFHKKALFVIEKLRAKGYKAYFCGGCVRDLLLGYEPKDYDIVTNAVPKAITNIFSRTVGVGAKFGVVQVLLDRQSFEVATFREDGRYQDGRHPESVNFSDEREDALRRDFTINGLFYDPKTDEIIDYVEGQKDLRRKIIRTIGNPEQRFCEDYLRLMRAIRFSCHLGFAIEEKTWACVMSLAPRIREISNERIRDELLRMLTGNCPAEALKLLKESGLLKQILPEVKLSPLYLSLVEIGAPFRQPDIPFAALLKTTGKSDYQSLSTICERLRLSSKSAKKIVNLAIWLDKFDCVSKMSLADLKRFLRVSFFSDLLEFYRLQCVVEKRDLHIYDYCQQKLSEYNSTLDPLPLVTGRDLIASGIEPGPIFKKILYFVEEQQLEERVKSTKEALSLVKERFKISLTKGKE